MWKKGVKIRGGVRVLVVSRVIATTKIIIIH